MATIKEIEYELEKLARQFLRESGNPRAADAVHLDASLERDLGIGSLERTKLFHRFEQHFSIRLPDTLLNESETLRDLVLSIEKAQPILPRLSHEKVKQLEPSQVNAEKTETLVHTLLTYCEKAAERPHLYLVQDDGSEKNHLAIFISKPNS